MTFVEKIKNTNWKDIGKRAFKTFIETFFAYLTFDAFIGITDADAFKTVLISTGISALSAAITAVLNMFISLLSKNITDSIDEEDDIIEEEVLG